MEFEIEAILVVLGLVLCPMVLLLLVSILIASLMATYTFLRDWQKPATQIDRQDLQKPPTQTNARNTLTDLPTELRLIIYKFALQDTVDSLVLTPPKTDAEFKTACAELQPSPFPGVLALNHTSRFFREESLDTFSSLLDAHFRAIKTRCEDLLAIQKRKLGEIDVGEGLKEETEQAFDDIGSLEQMTSNGILRLSAVNLLSKRASFGIISDAERRLAAQRVE
jgi:hypothetical protein